MNKNKLISKLDNGTPLTTEESKYLIDLVEEEEYAEGTDFSGLANIVLPIILLFTFTVGVVVGCVIL